MANLRNFFTHLPPPPYPTLPVWGRLEFKKLAIENTLLKIYTLSADQCRPFHGRRGLFGHTLFIGGGALLGTRFTSAEGTFGHTLFLLICAIATRPVPFYCYCAISWFIAHYSELFALSRILPTPLSYILKLY